MWEMIFAAPLNLVLPRRGSQGQKKAGPHTWPGFHPVLSRTTRTRYYEQPVRPPLALSQLQVIPVPLG